ncbi:MAG: XdhC/CoxI family protein [Tissierellaceae bacterium]|nr:XdhC/CoxI family protein [Tissierellaceae bacterium]
MADLFIMKKVLEEIDRGKEVAMATIIRSQGSTPRGNGTSMAVVEDGSIHGTIGGGALEKYVIELCLEAIKEGRNEVVNIPLNAKGVEMICGGGVEIFIDVYKVKAKLLIVGAGHVGHAIYEIASTLDFDIIVFEDRDEYLNGERFPKAKRLILGDPKEELQNYPIDENTYVILASRAHKYDEEALEAVWNSKAKYVGVMGSKKKIITMRKNLMGRGVPVEGLDKVYAPIGLEISSGSPEEIAVSIMAEVLLVKNDGSLKHMKDSIKNTSQQPK